MKPFSRHRMGTPFGDRSDGFKTQAWLTTNACGYDGSIIPVIITYSIEQDTAS